MSPPERQRSRRGSGAELRGEIVAAALALLEESADEAAVTMRGVARRAGIAAPSIYDHFAGLQELVAAAVMQAFANFERAMAVGIAPGLSPVQGLRAALSAYLGWAEANPGTYRVLFVRAHPSAVPEAGDRAGHLMRVLAAAIRHAAPDQPADTAAERAMWVWVELHGIASLRPANPKFAWPAAEDLVDGIMRRAGALPS